MEAATLLLESGRFRRRLDCAFGHAQMVKHDPIPTIYVEARATVTVDEAVEKALPLLSDFTTIGLATSVQHLQTLNQAREILTRAGKTVIVGDTGQIAYPGQVTGCNYSNVKSITQTKLKLTFL